MSEEIIHIWNPETGITGIDDALLTEENLCASIAEEWKVIRHENLTSKPFIHFLEKMDREWAIETGIIEGIYTLDSGTTTVLIEHGFKENLIQHGSSNLFAGELVEILNDHQQALEMVYDFIKNNRRITPSFIKELHSAITRSQEATEAKTTQGLRVTIPLLKGEWKKHPNNVVRGQRLFAYCSPEQTHSEMDRLIEMLHSYEAQNISPCLLAAWLHHRFTQIHPFQDGNGRVIRALCTAILVKAGLFYFNVKRDQRPSYIVALENADNGDLRSLLALFHRQQSDLLSLAKKL